jgi:hypothetical protein
VIADIVRRESVARRMIGGGIAVGTDAAIVMTETVTGLRSTGGGRGQGPETVSRIASVRTGIVHARTQGNTEDIDRGVRNTDVTKTATEGRETMIATSKEPRARSESKGVDPTAVEADRGRLTSTQGHAEKREKPKSSITQSLVSITPKPESFLRNSIAIPPTA